jgi:Tol biopolymer transport system component
MIRRKKWQFIFLFAILSLTLQGCLGINTGPFQNVAKGTDGNVQVNVDQASFKGNLYFTLNGNLYVLNGNDKQHPKQLTSGIQVSDPSVSPNGKWIAFAIIHQNYSDLAYMPVSGGKPTIVISGYGTYEPNGNYAPKSTAFWIEQPTWAPNSQDILFLSDLQKADYNIGVNAFLLDLQLYQIPMYDHNPSDAKVMAYSVYGDGGLRDPSYRPGHPDQIMYTNYQYDTTGTKQIIQVELENANIVQQDLIDNPNNPVYHPGAYGSGNYPSVPITTGTPNVMNLEPSFSPNGNYIVYTRRIDATHMSLYSMAVPNGVTGSASSAGINPPTASDYSAAMKPYSQSSKLLTGQYLSDPVWSPDGTQIAYYAYTNTTFDLWIADLVKDPKTNNYTIKPNSEIQLTKANGNLDADSRPFWAP